MSNCDFCFFVLAAARFESTGRERKRTTYREGRGGGISATGCKKGWVKGYSSPLSCRAKYGQCSAGVSPHRAGSLPRNSSKTTDCSGKHEKGVGRTDERAAVTIKTASCAKKSSYRFADNRCTHHAHGRRNTNDCVFMFLSGSSFPHHFFFIVWQRSPHRDAPHEAS
jgi:hypothetical protein